MSDDTAVPTAHEHDRQMGLLHLSPSRPADLELLARCMDVASWGFLNGRIVKDHPKAKADPDEPGPAGWGPFEEAVLGLRVDVGQGESPVDGLPHPFDSALQSFHLVVVLHLDRIRIMLLPTRVRYAAVDMSFQMREDRTDLPERGTVRDLADFAAMLATVCRAAVPNDGEEGTGARQELDRRARIYSTLGHAAIGSPVDVSLIPGDEGCDDIVIADGPDGQVHFSLPLRMATPIGHPMLRTVMAQPDGVAQMFSGYESMGWDGALRGSVSRHAGASVENHVPDPMDALRIAAEWSLYEPHVVDVGDSAEDEEEDR